MFNLTIIADINLLFSIIASFKLREQEEFITDYCVNTNFIYCLGNKIVIPLSEKGDFLQKIFRVNYKKFLQENSKYEIIE